MADIVAEGSAPRGSIDASRRYLGVEGAAQGSTFAASMPVAAIAVSPRAMASSGAPVPGHVMHGRSI
ncbi:MAG: hypothetical protein ABW220_15250, partial [Burkholderiaceae bacterium]